MSEKSHVSMEQRLCVICGQRFDTGAILLDKRLRPSMERHTITGWDLCGEHRKLHEEGFVALVEIDPGKSEQPAAGDKLFPGQVWRTGKIAHLRREVFPSIFDVVPEPSTPCVFVEPQVMAMLEAMAGDTQPPSE